MLKIKLVETGRHKIEVIKLIRLFTQLGLKESKELADNVPSILVSKRQDVGFEQIKKNFEAIGAVVEEIIEEKHPIAGAAGVDDSKTYIQPAPANKIIKDFDKKIAPVNLSSPQKFDLKSAIILATVAALVKSFLSIYLGYRTSYIIFIVAFGVAYLLRLKNPVADNKLGVTALSITLLYHFLSSISNWILLFMLYRYIEPFSMFDIIASFFRGLNIFVIIASLTAFVLASNKNIFKNLDKNNLQKEKNTKEIVEKKQIPDYKKKEKF